MRTDQELTAYIGLDWGDQRHAVQIQAAAGGPVEQLELEQRPHVLHGWVAQLRERFGGRPVGIAIEQRRGAVIHALMQYEFLVLYPVNPKALARYREAFHPSGAVHTKTINRSSRTHRSLSHRWVAGRADLRARGILSFRATRSYRTPERVLKTL